MTAISPLRDSVTKARGDCLKRLNEIERIVTDMRATLYDTDAHRVNGIRIEMKGRAVAEAFEIWHAVTEALDRAVKAKAS